MWPFHKPRTIDINAVQAFLQAHFTAYDAHVARDDNSTYRVILAARDADSPMLDEKQVSMACQKQFGIKPQIVISQHNQPRAAEPRMISGKKPSKIETQGTGRIVAVASGKGGVGKSTIAASLAIALANTGLRVGLLDADIYGPSMPILMGLSGQKPMQNDAGKIVPLIAHNVHVMSIGFMVDQAQALIWRGPMVQSAFKQLLTDVAWPDLDILILDTPPGTGDVQLTLAQSIDVAGAVIVSTPQELALADARKGVAMFQKLNVPVIGLLENMSGDIFGTGGGAAEAAKLQVPFLGSVPLDAAIRQSADAGAPVIPVAVSALASAIEQTIGSHHDQSAA